MFTCECGREPYIVYCDEGCCGGQPRWVDCDCGMLFEVDAGTEEEAIQQWNEHRKLTAKQFFGWVTSYDRRFGVHNDYRVGQAFINEIMPTVTDPDVFYCLDPRDAIVRIIHKYVKDQ